MFRRGYLVLSIFYCFFFIRSEEIQGIKILNVGSFQDKVNIYTEKGVFTIFSFLKNLYFLEHENKFYKCNITGKFDKFITVSPLFAVSYDDLSYEVLSIKYKLKNNFYVIKTKIGDLLAHFDENTKNFSIIFETLSNLCNLSKKAKIFKKYWPFETQDGLLIFISLEKNYLIEKSPLLINPYGKEIKLRSLFSLENNYYLVKKEDCKWAVVRFEEEKNALKLITEEVNRFTEEGIESYKIWDVILEYKDNFLGDYMVMVQIEINGVRKYFKARLNPSDYKNRKFVIMQLK